MPDFLSPRLRPLTAWLAFLVTQLTWYLWAVPAVYRCEHTPYRFDTFLGSTDTMTRFACLDPAFDVPCHRSTIARGKGLLTCRTLFQRPVRIVDKEALGQKRCEAELGQMATYVPGYDCQCLLPHGRLVEAGSFCAWRELYCRRVYGSGAMVIDPDGAWDFACGCEPPLRLDAESGKCVSA